MKRIWWSLWTALMGLLFLAAADGCRPNETVERQADDAGIKTSIKAKLASDVRFSTLGHVRHREQAAVASELEPA